VNNRQRAADVLAGNLHHATLLVLGEGGDLSRIVIVATGSAPPNAAQVSAELGSSIDKSRQAAAPPVSHLVVRNGDGAALLFPHDGHSCTDQTGLETLTRSSDKYIYQNLDQCPADATVRPGSKNNRFRTKADAAFVDGPTSPGAAPLEFLRG
jgi:hypothetical protein